MSRNLKRWVGWMVMVSLVGLAGCAGGGGPSTPEVAPPAGTKLAAVSIGMSDEEVRKVLGPADHTTSYMTGKAFIPFNFGAGDTSRADWIYQGEGRVVFTRNQWSGRLSVIKVLYNPDEMK